MLSKIEKIKMGLAVKHEKKVLQFKVQDYGTLKVKLLIRDR